MTPTEKIYKDYPFTQGTQIMRMYLMGKTEYHSCPDSVCNRCVYETYSNDFLSNKDLIVLFNPVHTHE